MAADAVDMNGLMLNSQALTIDALGKAFAATEARRQGILDRKLDEVDVEQAQANRYALTGTPNEQTASA